jgi:hypothetical protein
MYRVVFWMLRLAEVGLQRAGINAVIRQLVAAGVTEHVGVSLDAEIGCDGRLPPREIAAITFTEFAAGELPQH